MQKSISSPADGAMPSGVASGPAQARTTRRAWGLTWQTTTILLLLAASAFFFGINYAIFQDPSFTLKLLTLQLGFLPISVILITFFINRLIASREKATRLEKLSVVIGLFFSEVGTTLLRRLSEFDEDRDELGQRLSLTSAWTDEDYAKARQYLKTGQHSVQIYRGDVVGLRDFLVEKREFLMRLLENPSLLEHESFTNLLRAVFHLTDELAHRSDVTRLPATDCAHLEIDINRCYSSLLTEWLAYMRELRDTYPYFYSLAVRINPLNPNASAEVV
ncbi:MAG: hypothetical protein ACUVX1_13340 [Chloroflexota bacterium]